MNIFFFPAQTCDYYRHLVCERFPCKFLNMILFILLRHFLNISRNNSFAPCNRNVKVSIVKKKSAVSAKVFQLLWNCLSKYVQITKKKKKRHTSSLSYIDLEFMLHSRLNSIRNIWNSSFHHIYSNIQRGMICYTYYIWEAIVRYVLSYPNCLFKNKESALHICWAMKYWYMGST